MREPILFRWIYMWLVEHRSLKIPHGAAPWKVGLEYQTESEWDAFSWNPLTSLGYTEIDPAASPKPTWATLIEVNRKQKVVVRLNTINNKFDERTYRPFDEVRREITDLGPLKYGSSAVHIGQGIDHMTGLMHLSDGADLAGVSLPHIVMRDDQNEPLSVYTQSHLRQILEAAADRENIVESAHNIVGGKYQKNLKIAKDETASIDDQEAAIVVVEDIAENYATLLQAEIEKYDPAALPTDLPTLKALLIERIEASAMARVKEIKGASTQQGVDLPAACLDIANAVEEVSRKSALGIQNIDDAADNAAAQGAYNTAVAAVEAVTPLNVPEWVVTLPSGTSTTVTATAVHPTGQNIPGRVQITKWQVFDADGDPLSWTPIISRVNNAAELTADIPAGTKYPVTINLSARNLCGPSVNKVIVPAPE